MNRPPLLFAHRGGAALFPENTLFAFQQSIDRFKVDVLELDIHMSRDGELIVFHDNEVERTTNGTGLIYEKNLDQIKELDAGWRFTLDGGQTYPYRGRGLTVPTLKEVFEAFRHTGVGINIEIKRPYRNLENKLYNLIVGCGMVDRVLVVSGHSCVMNRFRAINKRGILTAGDTLDGLKALTLSKLCLGRFYNPKYDALQVPYVFRGMIQVVSERLVSLCKSKGIMLHVWTIDDMDTMRKLLDMGVDGIMTDRPDRLYEVFREYGYK
jgi:glycerophosphoryl diester phosphodiesterase